MNKSGFQIQRLTGAPDDPAVTFCRATRPRVLKLYRGSASVPLALEWRRAVPDGLLVLRTVAAGTEPLEALTALAREDVVYWRPFLAVGGAVVLEVRCNERFQTTPEDLAQLAIATDPAVDAICAAGFWAGVLITSEGNPPGADVGAPFFLQPRVLALLRRWRSDVPRLWPGARVLWGPHGYAHPPAGSDDPYHSTRATAILARLPADARLNYYQGEDGCDGGTEQPDRKPGQGWRAYFDRPAAYASWYAAKRAALAADPYCVGSALFLEAADPSSPPGQNWSTFDLGDEVDLRPIFLEPVGGPPIDWLEPVGAAPVEPGGLPVASVRLSVAERVATAAPENYGGAIGPVIGVLLHSTDGPAATIENQWTGTINWFQNPDAGVSAHRVVGGGALSEVCESVPDDRIAYHGGDPQGRAPSENGRRRGIEFAHGSGPSWDAVSYGSFAYAAGAELIARWHLADKARGWVWPVRLLTRGEMGAGVPGVGFHRDAPSGVVQGRQDPTPPFDAARLIAEALAWVTKLEGGTAPGPTPVNPAPVPIPPAPGHWPNGRVIASAADYDVHVWSPLMTAYQALMNGGNGQLGDDQDAAALLEIKRRNEVRHGIVR